jgi:hypothetical protein
MDSNTEYDWDDCPIDSYPCKHLSVGKGMRIERSTNVPETFSVYLKETLPKWEYFTLRNVETTYSPFELCTILQEQSVLACSDGGATSEAGSFGWILSTHDGERIAWCNGAAPRTVSSSFRSEGYGTLSLLCFFTRIAEFGNIDLASIDLFVGTDSESLVTRINTERQRMTVHPNDTLVSDWDITNEIQLRLRTFAPNIHVEHVTGHQDRDIPYEELPLMAQLNVEADELASQYMLDHPRTTSRVPRLTHNLCQLELPHGSINGRYKNTLRTAALRGDLWDHLMARNSWTETIISSIDWTAFERASTQGSLSPHRVALVKHFHGISPTGKIAHRNDPSQPSSCPCCDCLIETEDHVILCPAPIRRKWRSNFVDGLQRFLDSPSMDTNPHLSDILRHGILLWFSHAHYDPATVPQQFRLLVQEQNAIGWHHIFRGKLSKEWSRHQARHLARREQPDIKKSGNQWSRSVICHFLQRWLQLWKLRNNSRHGEDAETVAIALRAQVLRELHQVYSFRHDIIPRDQDLFYPTVELHIAAHPSTSVIQNWLSTNRSLIVASAKEASRRAIHGLRSIATYYLPAVPTLATEDTTVPPSLLPVPMAPPVRRPPARPAVD